MKIFTSCGVKLSKERFFSYFSQYSMYMYIDLILVFKKQKYLKQAFGKTFQVWYLLKPEFTYSRILSLFMSVGSLVKSTRYKESEDQAQKYILKNQITIFFTLFLSLTERVLRFQIHMSRATHKFQNTSLRVVILFAISHYYITKATPLQNSIFFLRSSSIFLNFFFEVGKLKIG